jgi:uroporphyrinogen III methyltransferase/synthase
MTSQTGTVYLVGAGPGDPGLLTLRGRALLEAADVVIYDYLANPNLLAWASVGAEKIYVGKKGGSGDAAHQGEIHRLMIEAALAGRATVRLKGGDPFIFGRGGEEAEALVAAGIPFEVVPGVTSAIAAPAYAGIPLTHRGCSSTVTFVTGHEDPDKTIDPVSWGRLISNSDTLVVLMGMGNLAGLVAKILEHGKSPSTPIALIQWATHPHQKTLVGLLGDIVTRVEEAQFRPPVVMVIGEVVKLAPALDWFSHRPLFGRRIAVTRARQQAGELGDLLSAHGAQVVLLPMIEIVPVSDWSALDAAMDRIERYDTLIFTSVNGVRFFRQRLAERRIDLRRLHGLSLCAIGPKTASKIEEWGMHVDVIPEQFQAEGVIDALEKQGIAGKRFLIPRARVAREILPDTLRQRGGEVDVVPVYETRHPDLGAEATRIGPEAIDMLTFASPSSVKNFMQTGHDGLPIANAKIACIGPITADCARAHGLTVDLIPPTYTIPALADAIVDYYGKHPATLSEDGVRPTRNTRDAACE